jgi:hypothetical protein
LPIAAGLLREEPLVAKRTPTRPASKIAPAAAEASHSPLAIAGRIQSSTRA